MSNGGPDPPKSTSAPASFERETKGTTTTTTTTTTSSSSATTLRATSPNNYGGAMGFLDYIEDEVLPEGLFGDLNLDGAMGFLGFIQDDGRVKSPELGGHSEINSSRKSMRHPKLAQSPQGSLGELGFSEFLDDGALPLDQPPTSSRLSTKPRSKPMFQDSHTIHPFSEREKAKEKEKEKNREKERAKVKQVREVVFLELENELMELRELHEKDREEGLMNCFLNQPEVDVLPEEELIQEVKSRRAKEREIEDVIWRIVFSLLRKQQGGEAEGGQRGVERHPLTKTGSLERNITQNLLGYIEMGEVTDRSQPRLPGDLVFESCPFSNEIPSPHLSSSQTSSQHLFKLVDRDDMPRLKQLTEVHGGSGLGKMLDDQGMSVIHYACSHGSLHVLWLMVRNGADLTQENEVSKLLPVEYLLNTNMKALKGEYILETVFSHLIKGVDVNKESGETTMLQKALKCGRTELVEALINAGADPMKINSKGLTSFDFITNWEGDEGPLIFKVLKRGCSSSDLSEIIEELYIKAVKAKNPDMQRCFHKEMFDVFEAVYFESGAFELPKGDKSKRRGKAGSVTQEDHLPRHHPSLLRAATKDRLYEILLSGETPDQWVRCFFFCFREVFAGQELFSSFWDSCERDESKVERVCKLIQIWFSNSPVDFRTKSLATLVQSFCSTPSFEKRQCVKRVAGLLETSKRPHRSEAFLNTYLVEGVTSLKLETLSPVVLAEHLTLWDYHLHCLITQNDLFAHATRGKKEGIKTVKDAIDFFNNVTFWVQLVVLQAPRAPDRAELYEKMVSMAMELLSLHNYNTCFAVFLGLHSDPIQRLQQTHVYVREDVKSNMKLLRTLFAQTASFKSYRFSYFLGREGGPAIAYLGLLLRDLLYFADSQKTMLGSNSRLLNFQKQTKIHQYLDDYHPLAGDQYDMKPSTDVFNFLSNIVVCSRLFSPEHLNELSREVEKKVGGAGGNSKNKRGNSQPDLISFIKEEGKKEKKERDIIHRNSARDRDGDRDKKRPAEAVKKRKKKLSLLSPSLNRRPTPNPLSPAGSPRTSPMYPPTSRTSPTFPLTLSPPISPPTSPTVNFAPLLSPPPKPLSPAPGSPLPPASLALPPAATTPPLTPPLLSPNTPPNSPLPPPLPSTFASSIPASPIFKEKRGEEEEGEKRKASFRRSQTELMRLKRTGSSLASQEIKRKEKIKEKEKEKDKKGKKKEKLKTKEREKEKEKDDKEREKEENGWAPTGEREGFWTALEKITKIRVMEEEDLGGEGEEGDDKLFLRLKSSLSSLGGMKEVSFGVGELSHESGGTKTIEQLTQWGELFSFQRIGFERPGDKERFLLCFPCFKTETEIMKSLSHFVIENGLTTGVKEFFELWLEKFYTEDFNSAQMHSLVSDFLNSLNNQELLESRLRHFIREQLTKRKFSQDIMKNFQTFWGFLGLDQLEQKGGPSLFSFSSKVVASQFFLWEAYLRFKLKIRSLIRGGIDIDCVKTHSKDVFLWIKDSLSKMPENMKDNAGEFLLEVCEHCFELGDYQTPYSIHLALEKVFGPDSLRGLSRILLKVSAFAAPFDKPTIVPISYIQGEITSIVPDSATPIMSSIPTPLSPSTSFIFPGSSSLTFSSSSSGSDTSGDSRAEPTPRKNKKVGFPDYSRDEYLLDVLDSHRSEAVFDIIMKLHTDALNIINRPQHFICPPDASVAQALSQIHGFSSHH